MSEFSQLQWLAQFGLGAVFAGVMFYFYRQDRKDSERRHEIMQERMLASRKESDERYAKLVDDFRSIIENNTAAMRDLAHSSKLGENSHRTR